MLEVKRKLNFFFSSLCFQALKLFLKNVASRILVMVMALDTVSECLASNLGKSQPAFVSEPSLDKATET